ncbi:MAG TPA: tyrosine-type recombinase/integrase [Chitinophagaceae bacterium]|jgi:Phage integrase family.
MLLPLSLICEKKNMRKDGTSIVFIQYCYSSEKRTNLNSGIAIPPKYWSKKKQIIGSDLPKEYGSVDVLLNELKQKLRFAEDIVDLAMRKNIENKGKFVKEAFDLNLDIEQLERSEEKIKQLAGKVEKINLDIYFQLDDYINIKTGKVSKATINVFNNIKAHLKAYEKFSEKRITFDTFDFDFYDRFVSFLTFDYVQPRFKKEIVGLKVNTVGKTIKQLKIFLKDRVRRKIIEPIDLNDYKVPDEESDAIYLSFDEIAAIYRTNLDLYPDLIADRNRFVVACLTGLRFSDFSLIEPHDLRDGLLYKKQKKSDHWVVIPLRKEAKEMLEQLFREKWTISSNPDFNRNIKTIGKLAGINNLITFIHKKGSAQIKITKAKCDWISSHTARRSFCTNEFLAGTPVKIIMQISGHKKEKDFYRYIKISSEEAAKIIQRIWQERNNMQAFNLIEKTTF